MSVLGSDGLSLSIGDGGGPEIFSVLRGASVNKFEMTQKLVDNPAVATNAWQAGTGITSRRATIACDALMTDETAPKRLRAVAISGLPVNIKLMLSATETLSLSVFVTSYQETIQAGSAKRFSCQLESNGAVAIA